MSHSGPPSRSSGPRARPTASRRWDASQPAGIRLAERLGVGRPDERVRVNDAMRMSGGLCRDDGNRTRVNGFAVPAIPSAKVRRCRSTLREADPHEPMTGHARRCCYRRCCRSPLDEIAGCRCGTPPNPGVAAISSRSGRCTPCPAITSFRTATALAAGARRGAGPPGLADTRIHVAPGLAGAN